MLFPNFWWIYLLKDLKVQIQIKSYWASQRTMSESHSTSKAGLKLQLHTSSPSPATFLLHHILRGSCTLTCGHSSLCVHTPTVSPINSCSGCLSGLGIYTAVVRPSSWGRIWERLAQSLVMGSRLLRQGFLEREEMRLHRHFLALCTPRPVRKGIVKGVL